MLRKKFKIRKIFNLLVLRLVLAFIIFLLMFSRKDELALYFFVLTSFVSFLDGLIARRNNAMSQLRSIFDPFADKLLINLTAIALLIKGVIPYWIMVIYLVKDVLIMSGAVAVLIKNAKTMFRMNAIDKVSVFIQMLTLFVAMTIGVDYVLAWVSIGFVALSFATTLMRSGVRVVKYKTELEEIRFSRLIKLPDLFTLLNIVMGLLAILFAIREKYYLSIFALLAAVALDYFDGKVARLINRHGEFGKQLDSLADTISFGVAPAIFGFTLIQSNFALITFALFLLAGVLRLARYNIMEFSGDFAGMPITVNGVLIPLVYVLQVPANAYPYIYLFSAILMVSPLKVKKIF